MCWNSKRSHWQLAAHVLHGAARDSRVADDDRAKSAPARSSYGAAVSSGRAVPATTSQRQ